MRHHVCFYVPSHMLAHIASAEAKEGRQPGPAQRSAVVSHQLRTQRRRSVLPVDALTTPPPGKHAREVYDDYVQLRLHSGTS